jgi:hypothetical protein
MLDIGVGAGRTTLYFAELVKEYVLYYPIRADQAVEWLF